MAPRLLIQNLGGVCSMPQVREIMTPRLLIQNTGRVCSTPQGTGNNFLKNRCTSSNVDGYSFVRDRAQRLKTMYNTPSILAQLGECNICVPASCQECVFPIQLANSPDTRACNSLPLVRQHTCRLGF